MHDDTANGDLPADLPACDAARTVSVPAPGGAGDASGTAPAAASRPAVSAMPGARKPPRRMRVGREGIFPW